MSICVWMMKSVVSLRFSVCPQSFSLMSIPSVQVAWRSSPNKGQFWSMYCCIFNNVYETVHNSVTILFLLTVYESAATQVMAIQQRAPLIKVHFTLQ